MEQGNNIESIKIRRINVPLIRGEQGNSVVGRYYLPEDPELEKYTIVGIQVHTGADDITASDPANSIKGFPFLNAGLFAFPYNVAVISLYNQKGEEQYYNFPIKQLGYTRRIPNKIYPFNFKISTRKSYIYIPVRTAIAPNFILNITLTFFLK